MSDELHAVETAAKNDSVFYSSSRVSLEASYMYALFARMYGNNNLPDSSNHDRWRRATSNGWPINSDHHTLR